MSAADPSIIPNQTATDAEWIAWYEILPFSRKDNNLLFIRAWNKRKGKDAYSKVLHDKMKAYGVSITPDGLAASVGAYVEGALDGVASALKVGTEIVVVVEVVAVVFTAALLWRILTPENVGKSLDIAAKTALV